MKTKITVGIDNIPSDGLKQEWGLSFFIEYDDKRILLDTGGSDLFLRNYGKLGIDINDVDYGVLSHAHCDHANGIPAFFEHNSKAKFYVSENTAPDCYGQILFVRFYCGIPKTMLDDYSDRIVKVSDIYKITDGVYIVPHKKGGYPEIGKKGHMLRKTKSGFVPDDLCHEQSLVLETDRGLVILNSCSHSGPGIIIDEVRKAFPNKNIYGYLGGLHLWNSPESDIRKYAHVFRKEGIKYIGTGHCTKNRAFRILKEELGDMIEQFRTGMVVEI
ncbi:MAG: MBL fold metallo-hydrolase [Eubacterium sp.]|nr:MBL fold metallo-hydrolase [Eubacterium sp.]